MRDEGQIATRPVTRSVSPNCAQRHEPKRLLPCLSDWQSVTWSQAGGADDSNSLSDTRRWSNRRTFAGGGRQHNGGGRECSGERAAAAVGAVGTGSTTGHGGFLGGQCRHRYRLAGRAEVGSRTGHSGGSGGAAGRSAIAEVRQT